MYAGPGGARPREQRQFSTTTAVDILHSVPGLAAAAANILLGDNDDGLEIFADSDGGGLAVANLISLGMGVPTCRRGSGPMVFDHFESDYVVTTAGVLTPQRNAAVEQERFDAARFECMIDSIHCSATFAGNDKALRVFDINDNLIWGFTLGAALNDPPGNALSEEQPIIGPMGSPLFIECDGTGAHVDGPLTVSGWIRRI